MNRNQTRRAFFRRVAGFAMGAAVLGRAITATTPPTHFVQGLAVSPDGARIVYLGSRGGRGQLYLRQMDLPEVRPVAGTEGADAPFFSPDGRWVGFFSAGKLKKVSLDRGEVLTVCDAAGSRGASWGPDETIIFTPGISGRLGLWRVSAAGGKPEPLTTPDATRAENSHRWPEVLPGRQAVLFTVEVAGKAFDEARIAVLSLRTGQWQVVLEGGSNARYAPTGHLVYARSGRLLAAPFDLRQLRVTGPGLALIEGVSAYHSIGHALYDFSTNGVLVYVPRSAWSTERTLVWVDRKGRARPVTAARREYSWPRLSPDGRRLAVSIGEGSNEHIWVYDLDRAAFTQLTSGTGLNVYPLWTPDGRRVTFSSNRTGVWNIFWQSADGRGPEEQLTKSPNTQFATSWSPDGKVLAFYELNPKTAGDIWLLSLEGERKPRPLFQTPAIEGVATFSPDGRWLAYASNESGRFEVYVQPYPGLGRRYQISTEGGWGPVWARSGRELFYRQSEKTMAVDVPKQASHAFGKPRLLFQGEYDFDPGQLNYDVAPDSRRFVMVKASEPAPVAMQLQVVRNWFNELKRRVPPAQ